MGAGAVTAPPARAMPMGLARLASLVVLIAFASGAGVARAGETGAGAARALPAASPPPLDPLAPDAAPPAATATPAEDVRPGTPITRKWWFWAGVGALVAGTVTVLILTNRPASAPRTDLGNMEAFRR